MSTAPTPEVLGPDGYRVLDAVLTRRHIRRIRRLMIETFDLPEDHEFFASPAHAYGPKAHDFDRSVKRILRRRIETVVPGHRAFMVAVTSKGSGSPLPIKFHQDWTYTDERRHRPIFLWCPLVDVDVDAGALQVVPGSHRWTTGIRPSRPVEVTEAVLDDLAERALSVPLRAGQALAFDPALCHGSPPNRRETPRPAITIALAPLEASLLHFHLGSDGSLTGAVVDEAFFTTNPYGTAPHGCPVADPWDRAVTVEDLRAAIRSHPPVGPSGR